MRVSRIWWLKPHYLAVIVFIPLLLLGYVATDEWFRLIGGQSKAITFVNFICSVLLVAFFSFFSWFGANSYRKSYIENVNLKNNSFYYILAIFFFFLYVLANLLLFWDFVSNPELFFLIGTSEVSQGYGRELATTISGITTLTQIGVPCIILLAFLSFRSEKRKKLLNLMIMTIIVLALLRAFARGERLALLELIVPLSLVYLRIYGISNILVKTIPYIMVCMLIILFGAYEYFRSWIHFYHNKYDSYLAFVLDRISCYYIMAQNSGASYLNTNASSNIPWLTNQWFMKFPGFELKDEWLQNYNSYMSFLRMNLNPQYNNISPVYSLQIDYGLLGAIIYIVILGFFSGRLYKQFVNGSGIGLILYPSWFVGILEFSRTFYFGSSRFFPIFITLMLTYFIVKVIENAGSSKR